VKRRNILIPIAGALVGGVLGGPVGLVAGAFPSIETMMKTKTKSSEVDCVCVAGAKGAMVAVAAMAGVAAGGLAGGGVAAVSSAMNDSKSSSKTE
jgi:hypothetical protein